LSQPSIPPSTTEGSNRSATFARRVDEGRAGDAWRPTLLLLQMNRSQRRLPGGLVPQNAGCWGQAFDFRCGPPDDSQYAMAQWFPSPTERAASSVTACASGTQRAAHPLNSPCRGVKTAARPSDTFFGYLRRSPQIEDVTPPVWPYETGRQPRSHHATTHRTTDRRCNGRLNDHDPCGRAPRRPGT
jgi:hypothetical protein